MLCGNCMKEEAVTIKEGTALCFDCYYEIYDDLGIESREIVIIKDREHIDINREFRA